MPDAAAVLTVDDLHKTYGERRGILRTRPPVEALRGVSFGLGAGGSLGIVGESGSGKTTIARILLGLETRSSGSIVAAGTELQDRPSAAMRVERSRLIQMVFQDPFTSLDPHASVGAGLDEIQRVHFDRSRVDRLARTSELLESVGLGERHASATPGELSGGQRQRVAIARALATEPRILVLDEAVSALDVSIQAQILNLLADLRARLGLAFVLISHDLAVVRQLTDRVLVLYRGTVVEEGPIEAVMGRPQHPYTRRLIASIPHPGMPLSGRAEASADDSPGGCLFAGRCELHHERCDEEPELRALANGHAARCWLAPAGPADATGDGST